jgi:hypothetical protein
MTRTDTRGPYFGKYPAKVVSNTDPQGMGRLRVDCPDVLGSGELSWAMPSVPYAGPGVGLFLIPPTDADVWVEFLGGDPDYPIWTGCFWGRAADVPASPAVAETKLLKTDGLTLTINDKQGGGGVTIEVSPPVVTASLKISLTSDGIVLDNASATTIKLTSVSVSVNNGALEVT